MKKKLIIIIISLFGGGFQLWAQKVVRYDLFVADTVVNYTGKKVHGISVNGQIPAPPLYFTQGDTAEVYLHNLMNTETSLHWHGIVLPNMQDGVPYLTTAPALPHTTHIYKFPILQNGTYWYHAHTGLQEQLGLDGALILRKKQKANGHEIPGEEETVSEERMREPKVVKDFPVVLLDWTNEKPMEVARSLKMANDWYAIKKGSTQNYGDALVKGYFGAKLRQEWLRMYPMDVSDVYYDALLINGMKEQSLPKLKAGDKIKLRIVNGSSSTYFWVQFAGSRLTVVGNDGNDVMPVDVDRLIIGIAETYDVIVTVPENMSYEFKATSEDRTRSTSLWLGDGMKMPAPVLPALKYFEGMKMMNRMMKFNGDMQNMGMQMQNQQMDMNTVMYPEITGEEKGKEKTPTSMKDTMPMKMDQKKPMKKHKKKGMKMDGDTKMKMGDKMPMKMGGDMQMNMNSETDIVTLNYGMLKAPRKTTLPAGPIKTLYFTLTGNMNRYQWSINWKTVGDTDKILIRKGENVRIIMNNQTMMRHPMHLHGQDFRLINGQGDYAPLKNVVDIMPMEVDTFEFAARNGGDWFFHCHILYHMMSGMGRVFNVENAPPNPQIDSIKNPWQKFVKEEKMWHFSTYVAAQSNGIFPKAMVMNRNYMFDVMGMINYKGGFESETHFGRYFGNRQFLKLYVGTDIRMLSHNLNLKPDSKEFLIENRKVATIGVQYLLPMFIQADLRIDHTGHVRFQISRNDLALTNRLRFDALWNTDNEYEFGLRYIITKRFSASANYDSHFGPGAGITFTY
jgi:CopA family copper-resistance protein